ncbi:putative nuclease HARBI1 [Pecten maximus]|uniref:putative nuclease HARBI1 n=1 Tax=Pecten maximus TaxID=6579 RepID=UPI001458F397|nr:putative nuclease HARBI1 [Pecten maximus]
MAMNIMFDVLGRQRTQQFHRDFSVLEDFTDNQVRARYRFSRENIVFIADLVRDELERPTKRSNALSVEMQHGGFPGVVGCIDGTQIRIQAPTQNEPTFVNRKGYHSINVQAICDEKKKLTNVVARWPGSTHDSHIFRMSDIKQYLEIHHRTLADGLILGDSGYACQKYLLTLYLRPATIQQDRYNECHKRTRTRIERAFGVWKRRFHVLHGEIRMRPERVCKIIGACAVLHNLAVSLKEPELDDANGVNDIINDAAVYNGPEDGHSVRRHITATYFD